MPSEPAMRAAKIAGNGAAGNPISASKKHEPMRFTLASNRQSSTNTPVQSTFDLAPLTTTYISEIRLADAGVKE